MWANRWPHPLGQSHAPDDSFEIAVPFLTRGLGEIGEGHRRDLPTPPLDVISAVRRSHFKYPSP